MNRSFANRIFLVIVGLVVLVQSVTVIASLDALRTDVRQKANDELAVGQRVFERLLSERAAQLSMAVHILASDYGFKEAIATSDVATIESVLANHGGRIKAGLTAFIADNGSVVTSTHAFSETLAAGEQGPFPFPELLRDAGVGNGATEIVLVPGAGAYQIVLTPVRAPEMIGWICIGFEINDSLARTFKDLTNLDVSFMSVERQELLASTLAGDVRGAMPAALDLAVERGPAPVEVRLLGAEFLTLKSPLPGSGKGLVAVLQTSLDEALQGYRDLFAKELLIATLALVLAIVCAKVVAGSVTLPLRQLAEAARRIAGGFYGERVAMRRNDEFGLVSTAFNEMQDGIAEREARIVHQARHDGLTGLPNRLALRDRLAVALVRAVRSQEAGAVVLVDIVAFKAINDALGHHTGDSVLQGVSRRLTAQARAADTVARYGGNSFVLLLEGAGEVAARQAARRILESCAESLQLPEAQLRIDLTVGMSLFPAHGDDPETLLRRAEIALYAARTAVQPMGIYAVGQDENHLRRLCLLNELALALDQDQLQMYYQPQLDLRDRQVRAAESLVRWIHPDRGVIAPDEFIPLAEQSGLIGQLTRVVLRKVIRQIRSWRSLGLELSVSVNVSALDLADATFADCVLEFLRQDGVHPAHLTLEMTESSVIRDVQNTREVMRRLREAGVNFSIDDFGTGYSSLAQIRSLPLHELKIDKSFVLNLADSEEDQLIVRSTIDLAHSMGLVVCAEGIESEAVIRLLVAMNCDIGQGFGISRPVPAEAFAQWLSSYEQGQRRAPMPGHAGAEAVAARAILIGEGSILPARG